MPVGDASYVLLSRPLPLRFFPLGSIVRARVGYIPDFDRHVPGAGHNRLAIRIEGHRCDFLAMRVLLCCLELESVYREATECQFWQQWQL